MTGLSFDLLDSCDTGSLSRSDLEMAAWEAGAELEVDPFDLVDPFAPDADEMDDPYMIGA